MTMGKKRIKRKRKNIDTLMIASYRERYNKESLKKIREIINQEKPSQIIILKIIEEEPTPEVVEASLGIEERKDFLESVREEKKSMADKYASDIIEITDQMDIPTEVHLRKGEDISEEIIEEFRRMNVDHVIIHGPKRGSFGKILEGSVTENVKEKLGIKKVTLLD